MQLTSRGIGRVVKSIERPNSWQMEKVSRCISLEQGLLYSDTDETWISAEFGEMRWV